MSITLGSRIKAGFACALIIFTASTAMPHGLAAEMASFSFVVIGDTPYAPREHEIGCGLSRTDEDMLTSAVADVQKGSYPFVIHIGDYKAGHEACTIKRDIRHQYLIETLQESGKPVFYTPGDNEWTDCDNPKTNAPVSDLNRLDRIRKTFFASLPAVPMSMQYERQDEQPENATWVYKRVRFMTLHVVATNNGRNYVTMDAFDRAKKAVDARDTANLAWLNRGFEAAREEGALAVVVAMQADMTDVPPKNKDIKCTIVSDDKLECDAFTDLRSSLRDAAKRFGKPVLLIHGDTEPFTLTPFPWHGSGPMPNLWRLNAAGDFKITENCKPNGGLRDVTLVEIDPSAQRPFIAVGLTTGAVPHDKIKP